MHFRNPGADLFIPDAAPAEKALARSECAGIVAHQDDLEILAFDGIQKCFANKTPSFLGVVLADGSGSPRTGPFADFTDEQMRVERQDEQKYAARLGRYSAVIQLNHPSSIVKDAFLPDATEDLIDILLSASPQTIYTHSPFDRHVTHVAVACRVVDAVRQLPAEKRPRRVVACEVWGSLDWVPAPLKLALDVSGDEPFAGSLLTVFASQLAGGKCYDQATLGRRRANATFYESHDVDRSTAVIFAVDMTPLVNDPSMDIEEYTLDYIEAFTNEVRKRIRDVRGARTVMV